MIDYHAVMIAGISMAMVLLLGIDLHVSEIGDDATGDGSTARPYRSITRALEDASAGDMVRVHPGTYDQSSGEIFPIEKTPGVGVIGDDADVCLVSGVPDQPVFRFPPSELYSQQDPLEGLTILGGLVGVSIELTDELAVSCEPTITNNVIRQNIEDGVNLSTAIYGELSRPKVTYNTIRNNGRIGFSAGWPNWGGTAEPYLVGNMILENGLHGIWLQGRTDGMAITVSNNVIRSNDGTGVLIGSGYGDRLFPIITNNEITGNLDRGIALLAYLGQGGSDGPIHAQLINNTVSGNGAVEIDVGGPTKVNVVNTIAWGDGIDLRGDLTGFSDYPLSVEWSDFETTDGWVDSSGPGNISADPQFRDSGNGDYRLSPASACIDAATSVDTPVADLRGILRVDIASVANTGGGSEPWYDMGSYEFTGTQDADGDTVAELADCDDQNPNVWRRPGEVMRMTLRRLAEEVELRWSAVVGGGLADAVRYDIATGAASELGQDGGFGRTICLEGDLSAESYVDARIGPPPGLVWYYLVRAENDCPAGGGTFGDGTVMPDPRDLLDDPSSSPVLPCP